MVAQNVVSQLRQRLESQAVKASLTYYYRQ